MPNPSLSKELMQEAIDAVEMYGNVVAASKALGIKRETLRHRSDKAQMHGIRPTRHREYTPALREKLGISHMVIPDVQSKPGVQNDHLTWAGNYAVDKQPDVIVCIGDFWDMPSLSHYDKGKIDFEGRRYTHDVKAGQIALDKFHKPIDDYNRTAKVKYEPRLVFCLGNHEIRIVRLVNDNPEYSGKFDIADLGITERGWTMHDFLKIVKIDGVEYSHFFTSGCMGRPVSSAAALLRERQCSATMGHVQHTDIAIHKKTLQTALFCGTFYQHDENYLGLQGNGQKRQIVMKHEVEDGCYDPMLVSLNFLRKRYS